MLPDVVVPVVVTVAAEPQPSVDETKVHVSPRSSAFAEMEAQLLLALVQSAFAT